MRRQKSDTIHISNCTADMQFLLLLALVSLSPSTAHRYRRQTGSSTLGGRCNQNIDCVSYTMWCIRGTCQCTGDSVASGNTCIDKIQPGESGCASNLQCYSAWPSTTCVAGVCTCATNYFASETRDGGVCVRSPVGGISNCPTPDDTDGLSPLVSGALVNSLTVLATTGTPNVCTAPGTCPQDSQMYDCVRTGLGLTTGVCCPTRQLTCIQPVLSGGTTDSVTRYYYDSSARACRSFQYRMGGATSTTTNGNNFVSSAQCEAYCLSICPRGHGQIQSSSATFNQATTYATCPTETSGSCSTNYDCEKVGNTYRCCPTTEFVCSNNGGRTTGTGGQAGFTPQTGVAAQNRYLYDASTGVCRPFSYLGGGGNYNNFWSQTECQTFCLSQTCSNGGEPLRLSSGALQTCSSSAQCTTSYICTSTSSGSTRICCPNIQTICEQVLGSACAAGTFTRAYWFNSQSRNCEEFTYNGCGGNSNRFRTYADCINTCSSSTGGAVRCEQGLGQKDSSGNYLQCSTTGTFTGGQFFAACNGNYECINDGTRTGCCPKKEYTCALSSNSGVTCVIAGGSRYYYDRTTGRCNSFIYNGCDGNSNNFLSLAKCNAYCGSGGCPNGGSVQTSTFGAPITCSSAVACNSGYECLSVTVANSATTRCCQKIASICRLQFTTGCTGSTVSTGLSNRYYFNPVTLVCQLVPVTSGSCTFSDNNFASLASCEQFCASSGCLSGEMAYLRPGTSTAMTCSTAMTGSCLPGYTCRYDSLKSRSVCCGSPSNNGCPSTYRAYMDVRTGTPRSCRPELGTSSCPSTYACSLSSQAIIGGSQYICCAPQDSSFCPTGYGTYINPSTNQPRSCIYSIFAPQSTCVSGYTCQTTITGISTTSGYCCTSSLACPSGSTLQVGTNGGATQCTIGFAFGCQTGYTCQTGAVGVTSGTGFCCTGGTTNAGCPPSTPYVWTPANGVSCDPYVPTTCTSPSSCQYGSITRQYACCSNVVQATTPVTGVCSVGQVSYQSRICSGYGDRSCPSPYFCQYVSDGTIRCCGVQANCPVGYAAQLTAGSTTLAVSCPTGVGCQTGYRCLSNTVGQRMCCTNTGIAVTTTCSGNQVLFNGVCLPRVGPNQACQVQTQCIGGSVCSAGFCRCASPLVAQNNQCVTVTVTPNCQTTQVQVGSICYAKSNPGQACTVAQQCQGGSICTAGVCRCQAGQIISGMNCITQGGGQLTGYCPSNQGVQTDGNVPRSCMGNTFGCSSPYTCQYTATRQSYYCCSSSGGGGGGGTPNSSGCPSPYTQTLSFPGFGPVVCSTNAAENKSCSSGYNCVFSSTNRIFQCCR